MDFSFQLYSARNFQPWDVVFRRVAELGYRQIEGFAGVYDDPGATRTLMDDNGLTMPSGHFDIVALEHNFEGVVEMARVLGISTIICPFLVADARPASASGWRELAKRLSDIGERVVASGRTFAWHNHDFEFDALAKGRTPMQILLEHAPAIAWQADLAWIVRAHQDPLHWIARYGERIIAAHIKDIAPHGNCINEDGWADIGYGTMAWRDLFNALKTQSACRLFIAEHDNPSDFERFARRSIAAMRRFVGSAHV